MIFTFIVIVLVLYVVIGTHKEYQLREQIKKTQFYKEWKTKKKK